MERGGLKRSLRRWTLTVVFAAVLMAVPRAGGGVVTWNVDPAASYVRLTIPDQTLNVPDLGEVTVRMRDANSSSQWTDAGGRRAALDGEIVTDYADGASITFLGGRHRVYAIEGTNLRPNPAKWNPATTNYTDTSTAPAAMGGRVRGTYILTFDAAFVAFRSVEFDVTNAAAGAIPISNGAFPANATLCGISTALVDADGLELPLGLGQPIPDMLHAQLDPVAQTNAAGGTITDLGGLNRKLTYTIDLPNFAFDLGGTMVNGSAAGLIVANAVLHEPPPPPTLTVTRQGPEIVLAWPADATGFSLEYASALPVSSWLPATPPPVVANGQNVVTNQTTLDAAFYRLRKPQ